MFWKKRKQHVPVTITRQQWGLTVRAIADVHGRLTLPNATPDLVFLLGDIGYRDVERIDETYSCSKYGVLGNHDEVDTFEDTNIIHVHGKTVEHNGLRIGGFGGVPRYSTKPKGQYAEEEAKLVLQRMGQADVLLAHSNPASVGEDDDIAHRGFQCFDDYMERVRPGYFFHGHIHESFETRRTQTSVYSIFETKLLTI